jgi:hypothetical protein
LLWPGKHKERRPARIIVVRQELQPSGETRTIAYLRDRLYSNYSTIERQDGQELLHS